MTTFETNALEINDLNKNYPGFSLNHLNLTLPSGCILGLIGENGAGKTTTIKLILDIIKKDSGSIRILGRDCTSATTILKEEIGVVLDEVGFQECLTPLQIGRIMKDIFHNWDPSLYDQYLQKFNLPNKKEFGKFSKGMKMKLAIAVALSHHAKLLILDEPTSGLDPFMRDEILDILYEFTRAEDQSVLISSHIVSDLERLCDYIAYIDQGSLKLYEEKDRLIEQYGILKCSKEELKEFDEQAVKGVRKNSYGVEALVDKLKMPKDYKTDTATLEEIIVFLSKGQEE